MRPPSAKMVGLATLALGLVSGVVVGAPELTWPYVTVSDVLATSGGPLVYASWVASLAMWIAARGPANAHALCGMVAILAPLFPLPYGTPFLLLPHCAAAPGACLMHGAWALTFLCVAFVWIVETRRAFAALAAVIGVMYFGGQVVGCAWMVAVGCAAEVAMCFLPAIYLPPPPPSTAGLFVFYHQLRPADATWAWRGMPKGWSHAGWGGSNNAQYPREEIFEGPRESLVEAEQALAATLAEQLRLGAIARYAVERTYTEIHRQNPSPTTTHQNEKFERKVPGIWGILSQEKSSFGERKKP